MRGTEKAVIARTMAERITPADAGNRGLHGFKPFSGKDHPRGCGEQKSSCFYMVRQKGSPPRMRGTVICTHTCTSTCRITPADAGNRILFRFRFSSHKDHPRGCGEQTIMVILLIVYRGSPPRMRGTVLLILFRHKSLRITPADAGNRNAFSKREQNVEDHPRGCGEQCIAGVFICLCKGSPPRMRGTVRTFEASFIGFGITPADAGNSIVDLIFRFTHEDHPRGCGEQNL